MIGLAKAEGDSIFLVDCDLEEVPENFTNLWGRYCSDENIDVAFGVQQSKPGGFFKKTLSTLFYKVFSFQKCSSQPSILFFHTFL